MIALLIISLVALSYALIRAFHDRHIRNGPWKAWAFIEAVLVGGLTVGFTVYALKLPWWEIFLLGPIFAFLFWLVFDCMVGYLFAGNILYLGTGSFDSRIKKIFLYNKPLWKWKEPGAFLFIFFKCFWLFILTGGYFSSLNN